MNPAMAPAREQQNPNVQPIPFTRASHEYTEPAFDFTFTPGAAQQFKQYDVPANGFIRSLVLEVTVSSAGALGTGVQHEDMPWALFSSLALSDVNGGQIYGPMSGYQSYLSNVFGAISPLPPKAAPTYSATYASISYVLRIPIEISHKNGLGALGNQNAAATYKVNMTLASISEILTSVGTATQNTYRVRGYLEAWTQPNPADPLGRPQMQTPPAHGTTQLWTAIRKDFTAGQNTIKIDRVGNMIRNVICVARTTAPARSNTVFPDPMRLSWDARDLLNHSQIVQRQLQRARLLDESNTGIDTGVFAFCFAAENNGKAGDDGPQFWLPTSQATRLEIVGTTAASGSIDVLINDVAPVETVPSERYMEKSDTGFTPRT